MCADIVASFTLPKVKSEISANATPSFEDVSPKAERCASPHTRFQSELLALFVKSELTASLAIPLLAVVVAMGLLPRAPLVSVLRWLATLFIAKGVLIYICRRFQMLDRDMIDFKRWRRYLAAGEMFYGTAWASILFVEFAADDQRSAFFFVFAAIMIVVAMRTMFASSVLPILYAGTVPMTFALVLRFALTGEPYYWAMAGLAVGIHVYLVFLASGLQSTVVAMLKYRARTDALVEKLKRANAESDEARRRAETANKAKSQFLANMSHELRTPLNAILGFSEVMKDEILGPLENDTYKTYSDDIHKSGQHLLNLINQILDLSRIEAGRYELQEEPVSLAKVMDDCQKLLKLRADSKGVRIVEQFNSEIAPLWAEQRAIRQICLNLLSNAVKFTPANGVITLSAGIT
ncbi:MAG: histidine kinase dimerization/phospho-acceptor domain-containing protein, partial [Alphaproteobacteria bacterium]